MKTWKKDSLTVEIYPNREDMGRAAAAAAGQVIRSLLEAKPGIRMIFAAAPSQDEFLAALAADPSIPFQRITAFHMDEYIGLPADAPQGFANFLRSRLFTKAPFGRVEYLNGQAADPEQECARYTALLREAPIDIVCMGIGENGHIAFNDPAFADFQDPKAVKIVKLDETCRQQQVHDGCFHQIGEVPTHALTLTIPALIQTDHIFCMVPASTKAEAVFHTLHDPVSEKVPASILRRCPGSILYLDTDSAARLPEGGSD